MLELGRTTLVYQSLTGGLNPTGCVCLDGFPRLPLAGRVIQQHLESVSTAGWTAWIARNSNGMCERSMHARHIKTNDKQRFVDPVSGTDDMTLLNISPLLGFPLHQDPISRFDFKPSASFPSGRNKTKEATIFATCDFNNEPTPEAHAQDLTSCVD